MDTATHLSQWIIGETTKNNRQSAHHNLQAWPSGYIAIRIHTLHRYTQNTIHYVQGHKARANNFLRQNAHYVLWQQLRNE